MEGLCIDGVAGLLETISSITHAIQKETLVTVFGEWKRRLKGVNESDGGYLGE